MTFSILVVCTGNICRSPQAEQLLRLGFSDANPVWRDRDRPQLVSAGVQAVVGAPMQDEAAALARSLGALTDQHVAKQLTKSMVDEADLILALARDHRGAVARLSPRSSRKTFTLREFARAIAQPGQPEAGEVEPVRKDLTAWVSYAASRRGYTASTPEADDVVDPFGKSQAVYQTSFDQIVPAVRYIVSRLAP